MFSSEHVLPEQRGAHLDRGSAGLRIDAAAVRHAHHQIAVAHHLAERARRDLVEPHRCIFVAPAEADAVERPAFDLHRRPAVMAKRHLRQKPQVVERLHHLVLDRPAARAPQRPCLHGVDLLSGVAVRHRSIGAFLLRDHVQLAEDLFERLHSFSPEAIRLPPVPVAPGEHVVRMGDAQLLVEPHRFELARVVFEGLAAAGGIAADALAD